MAWQNAVKALIPPDLVRDKLHPEYNMNADVVVDTWTHGFVGLDLLLHNRGGTALILSVNNEIVKSVPAGASFEINDLNIGLVLVNGTGTFLYDLIILGVTTKKLKALEAL